MRVLRVFSLLYCACAPLETPEAAPQLQSAWIRAENIRVDIREQQHQVTIEGSDLFVEESLDMRINGEVSISLNGDMSLSATADAVSVTAEQIELEGSVQTRISPSESR